MTVNERKEENSLKAKKIFKIYFGIYDDVSVCLSYFKSELSP